MSDKAIEDLTVLKWIEFRIEHNTTVYSSHAIEMQKPFNELNYYQMEILAYQQRYFDNMIEFQRMSCSKKDMYIHKRWVK